MTHTAGARRAAKIIVKSYQDATAIGIRTDLDWSDSIQATIETETAAPELLKACHEFVRFAELHADTVYIRYQVEAISAAKAAIAKAEGDES